MEGDSLYKQSLSMLCKHEKILNDIYNKSQYIFSINNYLNPYLSKNQFNGNGFKNIQEINECRLFEKRGDNNIIQDHTEIPYSTTEQIFEKTTRTKGLDYRHSMRPCFLSMR